MATPKVVSARCPSCGANLPVPAGAPQVVCRYCQNVIQVEMRKPPPQVTPFGMPGGMPSRTLYLDPDAAAKAGRGVGCFIAVMIFLTVILPIGFAVGPGVAKGCKGAVKPFPISCGINETVEVSGNYESAGPIVTSAAVNCKIKIKNAKLKGSTFIKSTTSNLEVTFDNVTLETTEDMFKAGVNFKAHIHGSTLTAKGVVFDIPSNFELDTDGSTFTSSTGSVVKTGYNFKLQAENAKFRGKKNTFDTKGLDITLKKASEVTSSEGIAIKGDSSMKIEADGGKIEGVEGAIVSTSSTTITAKGLVINAKDKAIVATSSLKLDLTDGAVTSQTEEAIELDSSGDIVLDNSRLQGVTAAITSKSNTKVKASKKSRIVATNGYGFLTTSNSELYLNDSTLDATNKGMKSTVNTKVKVQAGSKLTGKRGGVEAEGNLELEGTNGTIEGGAGPGIQAGYNARIDFRQSVLKGTPAIVTERKPSTLDLDGTRVEGEQKIPAR